MGERVDPNAPDSRENPPKQDGEARAQRDAVLAIRRHDLPRTERKSSRGLLQERKGQVPLQISRGRVVSRRLPVSSMYTW